MGLGRSLIILAMATFHCHYCVEDFSAPSEYLLLNHIRLVHSSEPGFSIQCTVNGCSRTFKNFRTYQNHKARKHNYPENPPPPIDQVDLGSSVDDEDVGFQQAAADALNNSEFSKDDMQSYAVRWMLKTRETRSLSRATTDGIIEDVQELVDLITESLKSRLHQVLVSKNVDEDTISTTIDNVFDSPVTRPFDGVMSFHQQLQYCRKNFDFVV